MWNPIQWPFQSQSGKSISSDASEQLKHSIHVSNSSATDIANTLRHPIIVRPQQFWSNQPSPRILQIEESVQEPNQTIPADVEGISEDSTTKLALNDTDANVAIISVNGDNMDEKSNTASKTINSLEHNDTTDTVGIAIESEQSRTEKQQRVPVSPKPVPPPSLSELDLLLEQYKRHRSISIDDPWSNSYMDGVTDRPMLPSLKENERFAELQET
jgi:hypothetical protein